MVELVDTAKPPRILFVIKKRYLYSQGLRFKKFIEYPYQVVPISTSVTHSITNSRNGNE